MHLTGHHMLMATSNYKHGMCMKDAWASSTNMTLTAYIINAYGISWFKTLSGVTRDRAEWASPIFVSSPSEVTCTLLMKFHASLYGHIVLSSNGGYFTQARQIRSPKPQLPPRHHRQVLRPRVKQLSWVRPVSAPLTSRMASVSFIEQIYV